MRMLINAVTRAEYLDTDHMLGTLRKQEEQIRKEVKTEMKTKKWICIEHKRASA